MRAGVDPSQLERLISSALESERIRSLPGLGAVDVLEGFDATRATCLSQDLARYRFIHISSHGIIDSEIPQLSALILGAWDRDGRVKDQYVRAGRSARSHVRCRSRRAERLRYGTGARVRRRRTHRFALRRALHAVRARLSARCGRCQMRLPPSS